MNNYDITNLIEHPSESKELRIKNKKEHKILIIGVTGMLGNNMYELLKKKNYNIYGTCRNKYDIKDDKIICFEHTKNNLINIFEYIKPNIIINCIAKLTENNYVDKENMIYSNITLPIYICDYCKINKIYFVHFSSDAIFKSSSKYNSINDKYTPESFYGMTKSISECISDDSLVLRICPIGYEKYTSRSLFNFIYNNKNSKINGYKNCYFNGISTIVIVTELIKIIENKTKLYGIHHITGPKISKYYLLQIINKSYDLKKKIIPIENPNISRLLEDELINSNTLSWEKMIKDLNIFIN